MEWIAIAGAIAMIVGNVISFVSQGITQSQNREEQHSINDLQRELAASTNQFSVEQWERENQYNLPSEQRQRLIDAGLNPGIMYGNGLMNEAAQSPTFQIPNNIDAYKAVAPQYNAQSAMTYAQIRNLNAQTENLESQSKMYDSQVRVNDNSIEIGNVRLQFDSKLSASQTGYYSRLAEDIERNWDLLEVNIEKAYAELEFIENQSFAQQLENYFMSETMQTRIDFELAKLNKIDSEIQLNRQQFSQLATLFVINKQIATETLNGLICENEFNAQTFNSRVKQAIAEADITSIEKLIAQNQDQMMQIDLANAAERRGRHTVVGRYLNDVFGSVGQLLGGSFSAGFNTSRHTNKSTIIRKVR